MSDVVVETTQCPNCGRPESPATLQLHAGVCPFCREAFRAANKAWLAGRVDEAARGFDEHAKPFAPAVWGDEGKPVGVSEFDMDSVEAEIEACNASDEVRAQAAEVIGRLFSWIWRGNRPSLCTANMRLGAVFLGLRPDLINLVYREVAAECGFTKAAVSKEVLRFQEQLGFKFSRTRPLDARRNMARKQIGNSNRRPPPGKESF